MIGLRTKRGKEINRGMRSWKCCRGLVGCSCGRAEGQKHAEGKSGYGGNAHGEEAGELFAENGLACPWHHLGHQATLSKRRTRCHAHRAASVAIHRLTACQQSAMSASSSSTANSRGGGCLRSSAHSASTAASVRRKKARREARSIHHASCGVTGSKRWQGWWGQSEGDQDAERATPMGVQSCCWQVKAC